MPARVVGRIELQGVRVFMNATSSAEKAFTLLGGAALTAAATVTVSMAGLTSAVAALGTVVVKSASKFESEMLQVQAVSGSTDQETAALSKEILKLSQSYNISQNEIAQAAREIEKSGVVLGKYETEIIQAALNLSVLTKGELSTGKAATFLGGTMTAWGIQGSEVYRITNALTTAANASAISVNDLIRSFQQVTAVANFVGFEFEDITAALAIMGQQYMRNSDAGTSLKQMMLRLMAPTKKSAELLNQYGINLHDAYGNAYPFPTIVEQLDNAFGKQALATGKITKAEQDYALATIFGSDAARAAAITAMAGIDNYNKMRKSMDENKTSAQKMVDTIQSGLIPRFGMFKNILESFASMGGMPIVKALSNGFDSLNQSLRGIDLNKFQVLGQYIVDLATKGETSSENLKRAFGEDVGRTIENLAKVFKTVRDSIEQNLIPGLFAIKNALLGEKTSTQTLGDAFNTLSATIKSIGEGTQNFMVFIAFVIEQVPKATKAITDFEVSLKNLAKTVSENQTLMRALEFGSAIVGIWLFTRGLIAAATGVVSLIGIVLKGAGSVAAFIFGLGGIIPALKNLGVVAAGVFNPISKALIGPLARVALSVSFVKDAFLILGRTVAPILAQTSVALRTVANVFLTLSKISIGQAIVSSFRVFMQFLPTVVGMLGRIPASFMLIRTAAMAAFAVITAGISPLVLIIAAVVAALAVLYIFWPQISAAVAQFASNVSNWFNNSILPTIIGVFSAIYNFLEPVLTIIGKLLLINIVATALLVGAALYGIYKVGQFVFNAVAAWIQQQIGYWNNLVTQVKGAWTAIGVAVNEFIQYFGVGFAQIKIFIAQLFGSVATAIGPTVSVVGQFFSNLLTSIGDWVSTALDNILKFLLDVVSALAELDPALKPVKDALVNFIIDARSGFKITGKEITDNFNNVNNQVTASLNGILKSAQDTSTGVITAFAAAGKGIADGIAFGAQSAIGSMDEIRQRAIDDARDAAAAWAGAMAGKPTEIGKDIAEFPNRVAKVKPSGPREDTGIGTYPGGGGGGEDADKWKKFFETALKALPLLNKELVDFLAGIAKEAPERAQPMVDSLMQQVGLIKEMAAEKAKLIAIDMEIFRIDQNIGRAQAELNKVNLQMKAVELRYAAQILGYQNQLLNVQWQMTQIQNEINKLQQENVTLARERIVLETSIFEQVQAIERIDREIGKLNRVDRQLELEKAKAYQAVLPALQEQARLENEISKVHNKRLQLLNEEQQLRINIQKIQIDEQLRGVNRQLEKAWTNMDVSSILSLDAEKLGLEDTSSAMQDRLDAIQAEMDLREAQENLTINLLEQEKLAVDETIQAYNDRMLLIDQAEERDKANRAVLIAELELEKQKIQDTIQPIQDKIFAIGQEIALEQQRNALRIFDLQQEYNQLALVAQQLQFNIQTLQMQMANEQLQMQQRAIQLEQYINEEELKKAALEETRLKQEQVYAELIAKFLDSMKQSGAFSAAEAIEVAKRIKLWDDSVGKLFEMYQEYQDLIKAVGDLGTQVTNLPSSKTIDIYINVHGSVPQLASGGYALGGMPHIVGEHGRELFFPDRSGLVIPHELTQTLLARSQPINRTTNVASTNNYTVNASYANTQSPASVAMDMRAMELMARR
jgi:TP901 family phage tail tape measure protein